MARYDVAIVGGGPAGSTLAIRLASEGRRVLLLEKASMPRDKLCGEFLSTEVSEMCRTLGVLDRMTSAGARPITRAICSVPDGPSLEFDLPGTALGLSRLTFDHILIEHARDAGADVRDATAADSIEGSLASGFCVATRSGDSFEARVVVGAYGRRTALDRKLGRPSMAVRTPFVAFKAHYSGSLPPGRVEVHTFEGGYCGLLGEERGLVNVCWITHRDRLDEAGGSPEALIQRMRHRNARLAARLDGLDAIQPFLAVSQLDFRPKGVFAGDVLLVGDAAGMIAPLCGDGMAMAMRSGLIAAPMIFDYLDGAKTAADLHARYRRGWSREFRTRMVVGRGLQSLFVRPVLLRPGLRLARLIPGLANLFVSATRG